MKIAITIFILMYVLMLALPKYRVYFTSIAALLMIIYNILPLNKVFISINWNVIMMILGTMMLVSIFANTGMPSRLADIMLSKVKNACIAIIALSAFSGIVSAFVDNVATVLMVAPVGLEICKKLHINPIPVIISICVSSNLQGAATLVGDTTSILLGDYAKMNFIDFIFWHGKLSIFWAVELGAIGTLVILYFLFKNNKEKVEVNNFTEVKDYVPSILMILVVVLLICASFFNIPYIDDLKNGIICLTLAIIGLVRELVNNKDSKVLKKINSEIDYPTIIMLIGLFIVIASIKEVGVIDTIASWFSSISGGNVFTLYLIIVFASVILSAFIDNIPYVAAMLPVVQSIAINLSINPVVLYFGLLSGATLGGNITPFGASANVTGIGILRKEGYEVKNSDFFKIGIPFTLTAVIISAAIIWLIWGL